MSSALSLGTRLGRFQLLWELGRGGMASVWIARESSANTGKQRLLAVKAMLPKLAQRSDFRSMFLDEGQLVRSIEHPSVVRVYEVGENQGVLYLAMEWVEGDSLYAMIKAAKQRRAIPPEQAIRIIADTAAGLHVAHELRGWDGELRGVVHCDVSPQNILVGLDGQTKLVDFGVAHAATHVDGDGGGDRVAGKAGYMSPEQVLGEKIDRRSDLFSLGVVLFELTTGARLFRGRDRAHTMHLVHIGEIPRPTAIHPDYPKPLEKIVLKALDRDREKRFQTAEEFARALERHLVDERTMVARSSVGQLLKRVLGDRIKERRENIRGALESLRDGNVNEFAAQAGAMPGGEVSLPSLSLSGVSHPGQSSADFESARASQFSLTGTDESAVAAIAPRPRPAPLKIILPVLVLAAGGLGAYFWTQDRPVSVTRISVEGDADEVASATVEGEGNAAPPQPSISPSDPDAGTSATNPDTTDPGSTSRGGRRSPGSRGTGGQPRADAPDEKTPDELPAGDPPARPDGPKPPAGSEPPATAAPPVKPTPTVSRPPVVPTKKRSDPDFSNPYR